jgi:DHA2 family multidrug resistance protein
MGRLDGLSIVLLALRSQLLLGIGLFGSVCLMPVVLAFVRGHGSLRIGETMLVTGLAQLVAAPGPVLFLERRLDERLLTTLASRLLQAAR